MKHFSTDSRASEGGSGSDDGDCNTNDGKWKRIKYKCGEVHRPNKKKIKNKTLERNMLYTLISFARLNEDKCRPFCFPFGSPRSCRYRLHYMFMLMLMLMPMLMLGELVQHRDKIFCVIEKLEIAAGVLLRLSYRFSHTIYESRIHWWFLSYEKQKQYSLFTM